MSFVERFIMYTIPILEGPLLEVPLYLSVVAVVHGCDLYYNTIDIISLALFLCTFLSQWLLIC